MLDPKSVADSICKIETELCYLHGLLAAEERRVAALQSGEAPNQQLKAEIAAIVAQYDIETKGFFVGDIDSSIYIDKLRQLSAV